MLYRPSVAMTGKRELSKDGFSHRRTCFHIVYSQLRKPTALYPGAPATGQLPLLSASDGEFKKPAALLADSEPSEATWE